jgi:hypothetical protein
MELTSTGLPIQNHPSLYSTMVLWSRTPSSFLGLPSRRPSERLKEAWYTSYLAKRVQKQLDNFLPGYRVANIWLFRDGFSIGVGDTIADQKTTSYIFQTISERKQKVAEIIEEATHDRLKAKPGTTIRESFESDVERQLNLARDQSGQYAQKHLKQDNNVKQTVVAGFKGSFINISQMSLCVGQQSVEGRRIPFGFRHRTLPHFTKDDFSPESRGFVENSYLRGLTLQEYFFYAMAGREGLIDTAVKTAETGYIQRRLVLEDVMLCYDGTVRNSLGGLVQWTYGEDVINGAFIEKQTIETFGLNDREFEHNYPGDVTDPAGGFLPGVLQVGVDDSSLEQPLFAIHGHRLLSLFPNLSFLQAWRWIAPASSEKNCARRSQTFTHRTQSESCITTSAASSFARQSAQTPGLSRNSY